MGKIEYFITLIILAHIGGIPTGYFFGEKLGIIVADIIIILGIAFPYVLVKFLMTHNIRYEYHN